MPDSDDQSALSDTIPPKTVVLVGMMGVGKTTVGRKLSEMLGIPFHDADHEIEVAANMSVADYFRAYGEEQFRIGERRVIRRLLKGPRHVLATGGGAFMDDRTRSLVKRVAVSVWLKADIDTILGRTGRKDSRPLLSGGDPRETLTRLLAEREACYAEADVAVDSMNGPHRETAVKILDALSGLGKSGMAGSGLDRQD